MLNIGIGYNHHSSIISVNMLGCWWWTCIWLHSFKVSHNQDFWVKPERKHLKGPVCSIHCHLLVRLQIATETTLKATQTRWDYTLIKTYLWMLLLTRTITIMQPLLVLLFTPGLNSTISTVHFKFCVSCSCPLSLPMRQQLEVNHHGLHHCLTSWSLTVIPKAFQYKSLTLNWKKKRIHQFHQWYFHSFSNVRFYSDNIEANLI